MLAGSGYWLLATKGSNLFITIIGILIFILTLLLVIIRPKGISEAVAAVAGAVAMLLFGLVKPGEALHVLGSQWDVFLFFLGLMTIAAIADTAGFFDWTAAWAVKLAKCSGRRLFINVFLLGVLLCTFLSNDATALILTPVVYTLVTRLNLNPLPFMFACTFIADTASFSLPVSNPINILVLGQFPAGLGDFLKHLLPASLLCIAINIGLFYWLFRKDLPRKFEYDDESPSAAIKNTGFFRYVLVCLGLVAVCYVAASLTGIYLSLVAIGGSLLLVVGAIFYQQFNLGQLSKEISWSLFLFVGGMFIVVQGVESIGLTKIIGSLLTSVAGQNSFLAVMFGTFETAIGANLINNVPMTLVMTSAIHQVGTVAPQIHTGLVYSTIFGADLGPNLTTVGSLATVLWLVILRRKGLEISSWQYFKLGLIAAPLMLLVGALSIWVSLLF